ncbi:TIGR03503 family protein [Pseudoalteromonas mariniglutinosa]|uniref:TIGR03503 family protein n=1 Tax=Pseudoalteromonas mariniglutinosa TaxID=206042 RepID=UPI00384BEBBE
MKIALLSLLLLCWSLQSTAKVSQQITLLTRDGQQNEIPLLENRFRIDHKVEKITLLFFRKHGDPAVVLVRPDGSKYNVNDALNNAEIEWFDELSYDLITIENPMPGPWQVVGSVLSDSRIMVLGEVTLQVEPLPKMLFRGETIKVTARILNDGKAVEVGQFRDVVNLHVDFISTNNSDYANFGAGTHNVTSFKDDGQGFDEKPLDGVFTGEFKLSFPAGEWQPEIYIETPILKRSVVQQPLVVHEPPFSYDLQLAADAEASHTLTIELDPNIVKPDTLLVQGKVYYPNNEEQMFTLDAVASEQRLLAIQNYDWGRYSVELSVFGSNVNGREFMATLPTYQFEIERPIEMVPEVIKPVIDLEQQQALAEKQRIEEQTMTTWLIVVLIIGGNLFVVVLGWLAIRIFVQKKPVRFKITVPFLQKKSKVPSNADESVENKVEKNGAKNDKSGEILNLSMSDD